MRLEIRSVLADLDTLDGTGYTPDDLADLLSKLEDLPDLPSPADGDSVPPGREAQGLHEVILIFEEDRFGEYQEAIVKLKRVWEIDVTPFVVLRAMREAADR